MKYIDFPTKFSRISYPLNNLKYSTINQGTEILFERLLTSSKYRCMYCGKDISKGFTHGINGSFNKEHTIEKSQKKDDSITTKTLIPYLGECKFNFSVACEDCNSHKENKVESIDKKFLDITYYSNTCSIKSCRQPCKLIKDAFTDYLNKNHIIVQPYGTESKTTKLDDKIVFDIENKIFLPDPKLSYSKTEKNYIESHITKLKLNTGRLSIMTALIPQLYEASKDPNYNIIHLLKKLDIEGKNIYGNVIDDLFIDSFNLLTTTQQKELVEMLYKKHLKLNRPRLMK